MIKGVIVPLVTPFKNGGLDLNSYERMVEYYINQGVSGLIPLGTTGENTTLSDYEYDLILNKTIEVNNGRVPVFVGYGGNNTMKLVRNIDKINKSNIDGILSVVPYYSKPDQRGIYEHFKAISMSTDKKIIMYNIPYRTGVNMQNDTVYRLSELDNIVGIKDCSGVLSQSIDLLENRPEGFSVLTGEDDFFYDNLARGGQGGIMASANLNTKEFIEVYNLMKNKKYLEALDKWNNIKDFIPMMFAEPNPTPVKYCLESLGVIDSREVRLPLVDVSKKLAEKLDKIVK